MDAKTESIKENAPDSAEKEKGPNPEVAAEGERQEAGEAVEELRQLSIVIVDLSKREIQLRMMERELVLELREFLQEHVYTCFFTAYNLVYRGVVISDYADLGCLAAIDSDLPPQDEKVARIEMRPILYTESTARAHVKRCTELLTTPCLLNALDNVSKDDLAVQAIEEAAAKEGVTDEEK